MCSLREMLNRGEIRDVKRVPGEFNMADALTKCVSGNSISHLMQVNRCAVRPACEIKEKFSKTAPGKQYLFLQDLKRRKMAEKSSEERFNSTLILETILAHGVSRIKKKKKIYGCPKEKKLECSVSKFALFVFIQNGIKVDWGIRNAQERWRRLRQHCTRAGHWNGATQASGKDWSS